MKNKCHIVLFILVLFVTSHCNSRKTPTTTFKKAYTLFNIDSLQKAGLLKVDSLFLHQYILKNDIITEWQILKTAYSEDRRKNLDRLKANYLQELQKTTCFYKIASSSARKGYQHELILKYRKDESDIEPYYGLYLLIIKGGFCLEAPLLAEKSLAGFISSGKQTVESRLYADSTLITIKVSSGCSDIGDEQGKPLCIKDSSITNSILTYYANRVFSTCSYRKETK